MEIGSSAFSPDRAWDRRRAKDLELVCLSIALQILLPLITRAAPAKAPILRPGVKGFGAGLGTGAELVAGGRIRRIEENRTRMKT